MHKPYSPKNMNNERTTHRKYTKEGAKKKAPVQGALSFFGAQKRT